MNFTRVKINFSSNPAHIIILCYNYNRICIFFFDGLSFTTKAQALLEKRKSEEVMDKVGEYTLQIMREARWYNNWLFSNIEPYLGKEILEVGAGIGNFTKLLIQKGEIVAIDMNDGYIRDLKKNFAKKTSAGFGDIEKGEYFFKNKKFETIVCMNVVEHVRDDSKAFQNMYKLLKFKGRLVLLVPAHPVLLGSLDINLGHFRRYTKGNLLRKLTKIGFEVADIREINLLGFLGWFFNSKVLKSQELSKIQLRIFDKVSRPFLTIERLVEPPVGLSLLVIANKK